MVGRNIARARDEQRWTQLELAQKIGTDPRAVSRWERGRVAPRGETMQQLAVMLGRELSWFYTDHDAVAA